VRASGDEAEFGAEDGSNSTIGDADLSGGWRFESPNGGSASTSDATISAADGHLRVTLRMTMEEYVAGVLASEARGFTSSESLKAMAVAIRTYATRFRGRHRADAYDFCDSTHCQALHLSGSDGRFLDAARATAGEILMYDGKPATTYYHQDCGGTTEAAGIGWRDVNTPYLTQQTDPYCTRASHEEWNAEISQGDLGKALTAAGITPPPGWHAIEVVTRTPSGRAHKLRLVGDTNLLIAAAALRLAVAHSLDGDQVRSDLFAVRVEGSRYIFSGVGSGHGVGLCQAGAAEMGIEGKNYDEILSFYYPGTTLQTPARRPTVVSGN
jgi:stage II sporulation protein D